MRGYARVSRLGWVLLTLLSHYRRHPAQTLFLFIGLLTGVGLWSAVQIINDHARASYSEADQLLGAQASHWIRSVGDKGVPPGVYIDLRRQGFTQVYPVIESRVSLDNGEPLWIVATDLLSLPRGGTPLGSGGGDWLALIQPPYQAWFPEPLAERLGIESGQTLRLEGGRTLPPATIRNQTQQGLRVFMDIGAALDVLNRDTFSYLAVAGLSPDAREQLRLALPDTLQIVPNRQRLDLTQLTQSLHTHLSAMSLLSFAVGLFIVFNAVRFSLHVRLNTLLTLRELGASVQLLSVAIALETLLWSVIGAGAGLAAGYALSSGLLPPVAATLQSLYGAVVGSDILLRADRALFAWLITLSGLVLALAWPLWRLSRQRVRSARSPTEHWLQDARARRWLTLGAGFLLLAATALYLNLASVTQGFVVLGLVLLAGAWLLPMILALGLGLAQGLVPNRTWRLRWAISDAWAQLPQVRVAMMALLLALTANLGVETLVGSFRAALTDWLDQRLAADIYIQDDRIRLEDLTDSTNPSWLADSHQRKGLRLRWRDRPALIRGLDTGAPDSRNLPLAEGGPGASRWYEGGADNRTVLANEQTRYLAGLRLGERISLPTADGREDFTVVGFYHDYGNPFFGFYLNYQAVAKLWPSASSEGLALWLAEGPQARMQAEAALAKAGAQPGDWIYQDTLKSVSLSIFDRTFAITRAMNGLTLTVAGLALLTALLAIHQQRLPQYAHWRAMGLRYREWMLIIALPLVLIVALTALASLPLGALLSWLLIHDMNVLAFGWTMPLQWQWSPAARLALLTLAVAGLTLAISLLQVRLRLPQVLKQLGGTDA